ncbi:hypothetical protein ART_0169 [Arthrobacter sp. PAMC 25486]|uniref:hypothetical protein n=1 Tax=Arthrobacter sp. PAMC 25486 TaxID=1494608 RepID=UPI0005362DD7|nr:hypothetical protein [Arthrobacter sp. PAMC 25486]AIX99767.1 hypothetical protein ART_0169 [Arthrobacter sp. PAMC 25486]
MAWLVRVVHTETGRREGILPIENPPWARKLNASGSGQASFVVGDVDSSGMPGRYLSEPILRTLVFEESGVPVFAGVIWTRTYDREAGKVTVSYTDINSIFGKRMCAAYSSAGMQGTTVGWSNLDLQTQLKRVIQQATTGTKFALPIIFPADKSGSAEREYKGYHMPIAADAMRDLIDTQYGPDVDFIPEYASNGELRHRLVTTPAPSLLVWNLTAPKDGAIGLTVTEDAGNVANHVIATGEGTEVDMLVRSAISGASPYPALVKTVAFSQVKDAGELQALANAELAASLKPVEQWSFSVVIGEEYKLSQLFPGAGVRAYMQNDPWMDDGFYRLRLIGFSGDFGAKVKLEFQPMEA